MKKSDLIEKLREIIRGKILVSKSLFEADEVPVETEEEKKKREEEEAKQAETDNKPDTAPTTEPGETGTEVGTVTNVAPPEIGTVTKVEPTQPPKPVSAEPDKSKETDSNVTPPSTVTKPDGVDTTTKVQPTRPDSDAGSSIKNIESNVDIQRMIKSLHGKGYPFINASDSEIRDILKNTGDVDVHGHTAKKIGGKTITVIFRKRSDNSWRVINGQIGSENKPLGGSKDKLMGTPIRDLDGKKVLDADGKPVIKYPGEWGAKYGKKSDDLKGHDLIPIYARNGYVTTNPNLKNAAGESKPKASKWRSIPLEKVKGVIVGKTIYWKK